VLAKTPKVQYYTMGLNRWQSSDVWPPANAKPVALYLASEGHANSLAGDGALVTASGAKDAPDKFTYDPMNPVLTHGGGFCCMVRTTTRARSTSAVKRRAKMCWSTAWVR